MKAMAHSRKLKWFLPLIILVSCTGNTIYHDNIDFTKGYWNAGDTLHFSVLVSDTVQPCDIILHMRNKGSYPFSNLYVVITTKAPTGASLTDTVEFILANARGEWLGKGFGDLWQNSRIYKSGIRFPHTGIYTFSLRQIMRPDLLNGVMDFGISVVKKNK